MSKPEAGTALVSARPDSETESADLSAGLSKVFYATAGVVAPSCDQLRRLMRAVDEMPLRFAPFFSRTAALFAVSESQVESLFAEFDRASAWVDSGVPGVKRLDVAPGKSLAEPQSYFLRCAPGAFLPTHRHLGVESVLVLEGSYVDDQGVRRVAGQVHILPADSMHALTVSELGCSIAVAGQGLEFVGVKRPA